LTTTPLELHAIVTADAPAAVGPYSQAVRAGDLLFVSGQLPLDPSSGAIVTGGIRAEAAQSLANVSAILAAAGTDATRVVKTTVLLTDLADFDVVNEIYAAHFGGAVLPARAAYQVAGLPRGARIEIEVIAAL